MKRPPKLSAAPKLTPIQLLVLEQLHLACPDATREVIRADLDLKTKFYVRALEEVAEELRLGKLDSDEWYEEAYTNTLAWQTEAKRLRQCLEDYAAIAGRKGGHARACLRYALPETKHDPATPDRWTRNT